MTQSMSKFTGLTMPVFTAFGWAGEETAISYALSQLEQFIAVLHARLPSHIQTELPYYGMSQESQGVYLAPTQEVESDAHIAFYARPLSLELQLAIVDKDVLAKGLKKATKDVVNCHRLVTQLGPEWSLRVQQMQIDEDSGEAAHYQDLFKDSVKELDQEACEAVVSKAEYLNGEEQWVTPVYLSRRFPSEQAAAMGKAIPKVMSEHIAELWPIFLLLSGRSARKPRKSKKKTRSKRKTKVTVPPTSAGGPQPKIEPDEGFTYVTELKPLHIRRGFVNLTPQHWPFFAINARTEIRDVTVYYDGIYDKKSTMWRLQPNDLARLVLSPAVHEWLEDNFSSSDMIQVTAQKLSDDEIQISLEPVD